jgi:hypothetical protein
MLETTPPFRLISYWTRLALDRKNPDEVYSGITSSLPMAA